MSVCNNYMGFAVASKKSDVKNNSERMKEVYCHQFRRKSVVSKVIYSVDFINTLRIIVEQTVEYKTVLY